MDKNTLLGMLLMGAVIFGFMWLNKPSEEELARQREIAEQQEAARLEAAQAAQVLTLDSVSAAERATIASTIRRFGTADSLTGAYTLDAREAHLTLSPEGAIGGIVDTDFGPVAAADIIAARYDGIPQQTAAAAVSNLKQSMAAVARYQGFARYLKGKESTVTLSNPDVTLEISTKGGGYQQSMAQQLQELRLHSAYADGSGHRRLQLHAHHRHTAARHTRVLLHSRSRR